MGPLFALVLACAPEAPEPAVRSITPAKGWTGEQTDVVIRGEHLLPLVSLGAEEPVGGTFRAWLEGPEGADEVEAVELSGVDRLDSSTLVAEVPANLEPGLYDLFVHTPAGLEARLDQGYRVTRTRADHLVFEATDAALDLGEFASVRLGVFAPDDSAVSADLLVEVVATSATDAAGVEFAAGQLGDQTELADGVGIRGTLGSDGQAGVLVRSTLADDVILTARAVEEGGVDEAELLLSWQPGALASLEITLPFTPFRAEAHVPFTVHLALRDAFGNPLPDVAARVSMSDDCDGLRRIVDLVGEADVEVVLDTACEANHLTVFNTSGEVVSLPFDVLAGEHVAYRVTAVPSTDVRAGVDAVLIIAEAVDAWGNLVRVQGGALSLTDSLSGLDPRSSCPELVDGIALCTTWLLRAGTVTVDVADELGLSGRSNVVQVVPDTAASLEIVPASLDAIAGNELNVVVAVFDAFGNVVEIEPGGVDAVTFFDDTGTLSCSWSRPVGDGSHVFVCTITAATEADELGASVDRLGVQGTASERVRVHNAELSVVEIGVPVSATAGVPFALTFRGFDAYGNAYTRQSDPVLDLDDSTGTLAPTSATLGASGEITTSGSITGASASARVRAAQFGVRLGTSAAFSVGSGAPASFRVSAAPWVGVNEDLDVTATAIDSWGNDVSSYSGTPSFSSTSGACGSDTAELVGGVAAVSLACGDVGVGERFTAADGTLSGESDLVDVVDFACTSGPVAELLLAGGTDPAVCLVAGVASVDVDATTSSSTAGVQVYSFVDDEDTRVRNASGTGTYTWADAGPRYVQALVVDAVGCADETDGWAWLGVEDGEPTGPVEIAVSAAEVTTGGIVTVSLLAHDCTGDLAVGQELLVRTDLGEPVGSSSGSGLSVTLDASAAGTTLWSFPEGFAEEATFYAGTSSAGAYGEVGVTVTQDSARPHVLEVTPAGEWTEAVSEIVVTFDETMLESSLSDVVLTGPDGAVELTASLSENVLVLTPAAPLDVVAGAYSLNIPSTVRDAAGNRLDGGWAGAAASAQFAFGDVRESLPSLGGCLAGASAFRPDGDDGAGSEADSAEITPVSSSSPTWWELRVSDAAGDRVRTLRTPGTAASITWDGRHDDGRVAVGGTYTLAVSAVDATENQALACSPSIALEHRLELP